MSFDFEEGVPILTTKNVWFKGIKTELIWFLGNHLKDPKYSKFERTNIRYLLDNGNRIWSEWPFKRYLESNNIHIPKVNSDNWNMMIREWEEQIKNDDDFCNIWGNLGPVYGTQWMDWGTHTPHTDRTDYGYMRHGRKYINQLQNSIDLLKNNPDSRRIMVNAWNPSEIEDMALPPCHYAFQLYSIEMTPEERTAYKNKYLKDNNLKEVSIEKIPKRRLSLMWNQRSADTFLGIPFNISSYALLLHLISREVNMVPFELKCNIGDVHLYSNHIEQAEEQLSRINAFKLPKIEITSNMSMFDLTTDDIKLKGYEKEKSIKAPIAV